MRLPIFLVSCQCTRGYRMHSAACQETGFARPREFPLVPSSCVETIGDLIYCHIHIHKERLQAIRSLNYRYEHIFKEKQSRAFLDQKLAVFCSCWAALCPGPIVHQVKLGMQTRSV